MRAALAAACSDVSGLNASAYVTDQVNVPQAIVGVEYDFDPQLVYGESKCAHRFTVTVFAGRIAEQAAQELLDSYVELAGTGSLIAAIQGDTALNDGSTADYAKVVEVIGPTERIVNGITYLAAELILEVVF